MIKFEQMLAGLQCPKCLDAHSFVVQQTANVVLYDDGYDTMGHEPGDDVFASVGKGLDESHSGLAADAHIRCGGARPSYDERGCGHIGTVAEFTIANWS